jgi:hypothetical protein
LNYVLHSHNITKYRKNSICRTRSMLNEEEVVRILKIKLK